MGSLKLRKCLVGGELDLDSENMNINRSVKIAKWTKFWEEYCVILNR